MIMEGDRLLSGEDVVTDDLLHLVADHIIEADEYFFRYQYNFTDGPVKLPYRNYWKSSKTKFEVIIDVLIRCGSRIWSRGGPRC